MTVNTPHTGILSDGDARPETNRHDRSLRGYFVRARILEGAAVVFGSKDVDRVRIEDVLVQAKVSRRTFYRFFANKEDLLVALFDVVSDLFVRSFEEAVVEATTPLHMVEAAVAQYLEHARSSRGLLRALAGEAGRPGSKLAPRRQAVMDRLAELMADRAEQVLGMRIDRLVLAGTLHALEGIQERLTREGPADDLSVMRARAAMLRIVTAVIAGEGLFVAPLPLEPRGKEQEETAR